MFDVAALRAAEFPIAEQLIYLNHAALGALPRRTVTALSALLNDFSTQGVLAEARWMPAVEQTRALLAGLLNVPPSTIAFVKNTSEGLNLVARGLATEAPAGAARSPTPFRSASRCSTLSRRVLRT